MNSFLDLTEDLLSETPLIDMADLWQLLFRFVFNFIVVGIIIHFFYYPKSKRRDYYFTFTLISISVFFLIFLLGSVKLKIGFALGIFAIFGIIRYRTESVPIREMTYLFTITALSVINALSIQVGLTEMLVTNAIFLLVTCLLESERWLKHTTGFNLSHPTNGKNSSQTSPPARGCTYKRSRSDISTSFGTPHSSKFTTNRTAGKQTPWII